LVLSTVPIPPNYSFILFRDSAAMKPQHLRSSTAGIRLVASISLSIAIGSCLFAGTGRADTSVAEVKAQALDAWKRYREAAGRLQGEMVITATEKPSGKLLFQERWKLRQSLPKRTLSIHTGLGPEKYSEYASVQNDSYFFDLVRESNDSPWVIKEFYDRPKDSPSGEREGGSSFKSVLAMPCTGSLLYSKYISDLLDDPGFVITSAEDRAGGVVRLNFTYDGKASGFPLKSGWFDLDREHLFVIREYDAKAEWIDGVGSIQDRFEYVIESDGFPRIYRSVRLQKGVSETAESVTEFDYSFTIPVSKSDFTLSAFGLPEPPGPSRSFLPTSVFFWTTALLLVGLLSLMTAARLNRR
jgi:hypothetical protein